MPIDDLVDKYLLTPADVDGSSVHPLVQTFVDSSITPLIDGNDYFEGLYDAIAALSGPASEHVIYIAAWHFRTTFAFQVDDGVHPSRFVELLAFKASQGADVRVLIWVNDFLMATGLPLPNIPGELARPFAPHVEKNVENLTTIRDLQSHPNTGPAGSTPALPLADRVIANTLDHPYGAVHTKFALVMDASQAKGFTGGIDPVLDRFSGTLHRTELPRDLARRDGHGRR